MKTFSLWILKQEKRTRRLSNPRLARTRGPRLLRGRKKILLDMKTKRLFFCLFWATAALLSCVERENRPEMFTIDVSKTYPKKKMRLSDLCDIEYVAIDDSIVVSGRPRWTTDEYFIYTGQGGDIVFFDRAGRFVRRFNHRGQGPGEYTAVGKLLVDEASGQLVVTSGRSILFYSLTGEFQRSLKLDDKYAISDLKDYDQDFFLVDNGVFRSPIYLFVSKRDGTVADSLTFGIDKPIRPYAQRKEGGMTYTFMPPSYNLVKTNGRFLITQTSLDTFYYLHDRKLTPFLVREPAVHSRMEPTLLNAWLETSDYGFFSTVDLGFNFETQEGFDQHYFVLEKSTRAIHEVEIEHADLEGFDIHLDPATIERSADPSLGLHVLEAEDLRAALAENRVHNPRLAALARELKEDSNPVLMITRFGKKGK